MKTHNGNIAERLFQLILVRQFYFVGLNTPWRCFPLYVCNQIFLNHHSQTSWQIIHQLNILIYFRLQLFKFSIPVALVCFKNILTINLRSGFKILYAPIDEYSDAALP
jgi:hypothetical protein